MVRATSDRLPPLNKAPKAKLSGAGMSNHTGLIAAAIVVAASLVVPALGAQNNVVVPNAYATTEGPSGSSTILFVSGTGGAIIQMYLDNSQLTNYSTGDKITGFAVRMDSIQSANAGISYTQYDVEFSEADSASSAAGMLASTTFATNQGSTPVMVRSGSITVPAGTPSTGSTPNAFDFFVPFTTPYTYTAGTDIVITVHSAGLSGAGGLRLDGAVETAGVSDWQFTSNTSSTFATTTTSNAPIIKLLSEAGMDLVDGATPVAHAGTINLGSQGTAGSSFTHSVTIENNGGSDLTITTPVSAPGSLSNCGASISVQPSATVSAGSSTTLEVQITPSGGGAYSCTVSIANNDSDENPYVFTITGMAATSAPEMDLLRSATPVADGGTDAAGDVDYGVTQTVTYTIENNGNAPLSLTGGTLVVVTAGTNVTSATVTAQPSSSVAASGSTTFTISYQTMGAGAWNFSVSIDNDDSDENPYNWAVSGTSTNAGSTPVSGGSGGGGGSCTADSSGRSTWLVLLGLISLFAFAAGTRRTS